MLEAILKLFKKILWDGLFSKILSATSDKVVESVSDAVAERVGKTLDGGQPATELGDATHVVPKGLRYFDEHDAGFFLKLLPGPYREDGLPESLYFWKTRIEEPDGDKTFQVGVIYGPSGCGKSSLVRAGLIPHFDESVIPILIEATPDDTEKELLGELKKHAPFLNPKTSLRAALRRKDEVPSGKKLLIVLDQFEQWLHGRDEGEYEELAEALCECDGAKIQCVLMIRDDFWTPLCRFLKQLEVPLREHENGTLVDLFDKRHAKRVLVVFGQAYGALPASGTLSPDQEDFVDQAIDDLAENGRVICVRLALFAQMVKRWEWKPATLKRLGGTEGVGVAFLEESLAAKEAPASVRQHQKQAEAVLRALLPEQGTDIKGSRRSRAELMEQSGYGSRPDEFIELLEILDANLRLITPTESTEQADDATETEPAEKHYQLTHDYLVPSLREWLTRKQRETRRGRAVLRLEEHSQLWNSKRHNQYLPGPVSFVSIWCLTKGKDWTNIQRKMMRQATKYYGIVSGVFMAIALSVLLGGWEIRGRSAAPGIVDDLLRAKTEQVSQLLPQIRSHRRWIVPKLERELGPETIIPTKEKDRHDVFEQQSNAAVALAVLGRTAKVWPLFKHSADPTRRSYLIHRYAASGGDPEVLLGQLDSESDISIRRALILTLGEFDGKRLPDTESFINLLLKLYVEDTDPGIHSASHRVLGEWQREKWLGDKGSKQWEAAKHRLATGKPKDDQQWYVTTGKGPSDCHTMVVLPNDSYWYGDPPKQQNLDHQFAISTTEVTVQQFRRFLQGKADVHDETVSPDDDSPVNQVTWYLAAEYCNWLSEHEGIHEVQWCYEPNEQDEYDEGMTIYPQRDGYRLPTEEEWEYACRAGSSTWFGFGDADELLGNYASYSSSLGDYESTHTIARLKPNDFGLFDMHGNVYEWCQGPFKRIEKMADSPESEEVSGSVKRVLRGGSFRSGTANCQSAIRNYRHPYERYDNIGFRVSRSYP